MRGLFQINRWEYFSGLKLTRENTKEEYLIMLEIGSDRTDELYLRIRLGI